MSAHYSIAVKDGCLLDDSLGHQVADGHVSLQEKPNSCARDIVLHQLVDHTTAVRYEYYALHRNCLLDVVPPLLETGKRIINVRA